MNQCDYKGTTGEGEGGGLSNTDDLLTLQSLFRFLVEYPNILRKHIRDALFKYTEIRNRKWDPSCELRLKLFIVADGWYE